MHPDIMLCQIGREHRSGVDRQEIELSCCCLLRLMKQNNNRCLQPICKHSLFVNFFCHCYTVADV